MSQNMNTTSEPTHTSGHSTTVARQENGEFMCPECGKIFNAKDTAEKHLHSVHAEHLRTVHGEFHKSRM